MSDTVPVVFSRDELWLMRSFVRHELVAGGTWAYPPASLSLNDQIADALYLCFEAGQTEACLQLSRGDTLALDYVIPDSAKAANGQPLGALILHKVILARHALAASDGDDAAEPAGLPTAAQVSGTLKERDHAEHDHDTNRGTDDSTSTE